MKSLFLRIDRALFPKKDVPQSKNQMVLTAIVLIACIWVGGEIPNRLMVAVTNSVGYRLFYYERDQKPSEISKNSFVVFPLYTDINKGCNPCKVVKKAACVEGEELKTTQDGYFYCGDQYLGVARNKTSDGREVSPFIYNGIIPKGKFFAFGGSVKSYDSRYFGFVEKKVVEGIAKPII